MDYCGFFMQNDLLHDLGRLMSPPVSLCRSEICESGSSGFDCAANILPDGGFIPASDPLDDMRNDAHEEFLHNGVVVELDELDKYQSRLRERTSSEILTNEQNPVLLEYLRMRERRRDRKTKKVCVFCKNNGEPANVYQGHVLKDGQGRVSCPILRKYTCPLCGTSGDTAHTIRYCPLGDSDATACSTLALLKTNRLSTGKKRKC